MQQDFLSLSTRSSVRSIEVRFRKVTTHLMESVAETTNHTIIASLIREAFLAYFTTL